jgi:hypothetical protein
LLAGISTVAAILPRRLLLPVRRCGALDSSRGFDRHVIRQQRPDKLLVVARTIA